MPVTYKEFVEKAMPEEKRTWARKDLSYYLFRPICNLLSLRCLRWNIAAMSITKFSLLFPLLALIFFACLPNAAGLWSGWVAIFIWNILDGVDGDIARFTDTCSPMGELWDATVGWIAMIVFFIGMGLTAFYHAGNDLILSSISPSIYLALGIITAILTMFPRQVMHKKSTIMGKESANAVKSRTNYGWPKVIVLNLNSINGLGALLFAAAYCLHLNGLCTICYFLLNSVICVGTLYKLLK